MRGHTDRVLSVGWSRDGTRLASASADTTIRIHDARVGYGVERSRDLLPLLNQRLGADPLLAQIDEPRLGKQGACRPS